jgi:tetratricopeptide (TPR) repeat protein
MERKKYSVVIILLLAGVMAKGADYRSEIYKAYIGNRMDLWKKTIDEMSRQKTDDPAWLLELVNYQYGYIGWALGNNQKKEASKMLDEAVVNISKIEKAGYQPSWVHGYKSAFYGFKISFNPLKAPFIGPKSMEQAKLSVETGPSNYFGFVQLGNIWFYMPAAFGGSKKKALEYLLDAQKLMEKDAGQLKGNWNYMSLLAFIGQAQMEIKEYTEAKTTFDKILKLEPGFSWVKDELYPQLLNKIKDEK